MFPCKHSGDVSPSWLSNQLCFPVKLWPQEIMLHIIFVLTFSLTHFLFLSLLLSRDKIPKTLKLFLMVWFPGNLDFDIHEGSISSHRCYNLLIGCEITFSALISAFENIMKQKRSKISECIICNEGKYHFLKLLFQLYVYVWGCICVLSYIKCVFYCVSWPIKFEIHWSR